MDSPFMDFFADGLAARGFRVARFEFPYMAGRRGGGPKRPPDAMPVLAATWRQALAELIPMVGRERLAIGGKSMGGRVASMIADQFRVAGVACLGYPFHPAGRPDKPRTGHLGSLRTPTLICQGSRDALGNRRVVEGYTLSPAIRIRWLEGGDHGFVPLAGSGRGRAELWTEALNEVAGFLAALARRH